VRHLMGRQPVPEERRAGVVVPKVWRTCARVRVGPGRRRQAVTVAWWTSRPAQRSRMTSMGSSGVAGAPGELQETRRCSAYSWQQGGAPDAPG
jgi:hypothetical protein